MIPREDEEEDGPSSGAPSPHEPFTEAEAFGDAVYHRLANQ